MDTLKSGQPPNNGHTVHPLPIYCPYISTSEEETTFEQWTKCSSRICPLFGGYIVCIWVWEGNCCTVCWGKSPTITCDYWWMCITGIELFALSLSCSSLNFTCVMNFRLLIRYNFQIPKVSSTERFSQLQYGRKAKVTDRHVQTVKIIIDGVNRHFFTAQYSHTYYGYHTICYSFTRKNKSPFLASNTAHQ